MLEFVHYIELIQKSALRIRADAPPCFQNICKTCVSQGAFWVLKMGQSGEFQNMFQDWKKWRIFQIEQNSWEKVLNSILQNWPYTLYSENIEGTVLWKKKNKNGPFYISIYLYG